MPEVFSRLLNNIAEFWRNLDKSQKTRIYIISSILGVVLTVGIILLTRVSYKELIGVKDTAEAKVIITALEEKGIKYKLSDSGNSIMVDSKDLERAKVAYIQSDSPSTTGSIFADAFDNIKINSTESDKRKLWEDTEERKISQRLKMLDNIEDASVDLALPEPSIYVLSEQDLEKPTASVMVKPKEKLTAKQVNAVVMMVARSVENLDPKDVSVVDFDLNELTNTLGDDEVEKANSQEELRLRRKKELADNVKKLFAGQFATFEDIAVVANPILDFDILKEKSKEISNPTGMDTGALKSSEITKETLENGTVNGVPGTNTNPGDTDSPTYQVGGETNSNYNKSHEIKNYDHNETLKEMEKATGEMVPEKSTMAINLSYGNRVTDENAINEEIEKVKQVASSATGIPVANIAVHKFKRAAVQPVEKPMSDTIRQLITDYGVFALVLLLIVVLMIAAIPRKKRVIMQTEPALAEVSAAAESGFAIKQEVPIEPLPDIDVEERSEVKKQIEKFVKQKPDAVAQLLRNWLQDDWD